jgi:hypothetical protein
MGRNGHPAPQLLCTATVSQRPPPADQQEMEPATLPGQPKEDEELVPTPPAQPLADGQPSGRRASNAPPHTPSSPKVGAPHTATGADAAGAADDVAPASGDRHEDAADDIEQRPLLVAGAEAPAAGPEPAPQPGAEQPHSEAPRVEETDENAGASKAWAREAS